MQIPTDLLHGKKILVGVSGSIAIYKTLELIRLYIKAGAEVKVVMSEAAKKFITPLTFETISRHEVLHAENESWATTHNHIQAAQWANVMVIAPATANTIAKLANAIADNLLLQCALAYPNAKLIAPSANTNMLYNPITEGSMKMLRLANYEIVGTQVKELACQTTGDGAMAEPLDIFWHTARLLLREPFWEDRRVVVTGGGTIEKIDDVRYISNYSSGKMASALATALYLRGADVNLIYTRKSEGLPSGIHTIDVESSAEMLEYLTDSIRIAKKGKMSQPSLVHDAPMQLIQKRPYLFMAAAVSDYVPEHPQEGKLKKSMLGKTWQLSLTQNHDLLSSIDKDGISTIAFKAEMDADHAIKNASALIDTKGVDAVCLNILNDRHSFGTEENQIDFITAKEVVSLPRANKYALALAIIKQAEEV